MRFENDEVSVGSLKAVGRLGVNVTPRPREEQEHRGRAGQGRGQEHPSEHPTGVTPHRLVRYGEKYAGVAANEKAEHSTDRAPDEAGSSPEHAGNRTRRTEPSDLRDRAQERQEREHTEHEERPRAEADRRLGPERDA